MVNDFRLNRSGVVILLAVGIFVMVFLVYAGRGRYVEETVKISELLSASIHLAEAGGAMVVHIRKMDDSEIGQLTKGLTIKEGANEYATLGNRKSLEIITSGLKAAWPRLNYKSKEIEREVVKGVAPSVGNVEVLGLANRDEAVPLDKVTVWIDPLDAGQEYIDGATEAELLKYTAVMVCIAVEGEPIAGVIHLPFLTDVRTEQIGVTKWAWVHHGVSHTLQRDISSMSKDGNTVRVIASRSHPGDVFSVAESSFKDYKSVENIVAAGAGYKALEVAERKADVYLHTVAINKWDICPGNAILNTLGGKMTTQRGKEIDYSPDGDPKITDGIIATATEKEHADYLSKLRI